MSPLSFAFAAASFFKRHTSRASPPALPPSRFPLLPHPITCNPLTHSSIIILFEGEKLVFPLPPSTRGRPSLPTTLRNTTPHYHHLLPSLEAATNERTVDLCRADETFILHRSILLPPPPPRSHPLSPAPTTKVPKVDRSPHAYCRVLLIGLDPNWNEI